MASVKAMMSDDLSFPPGSPSQELKRDEPDKFPVDPVSSQVATFSKKHKEKAGARTRTGAAAEAKKITETIAEDDEFSDLSSNLMSSVLMISGVAVAAVGMTFFVTRKL